MIYDFDTWIDRTPQGSEKWLAMHRLKKDVAPDTVPLSVADMEFALAPEIRDGLIEHLGTAVLGYTGPVHYYFDTICQWLEKRQKLFIENSWIVPTAGVVTGIGLAIRSCTEPGDGVIVMTPVYYPFFHVIHETGRTLLQMELTNTMGSYSIDMDMLEKLASDKRAKALLFCSPHNPVGRVWTSEELAAIGDICERHNLYIISDEIHGDLIMPGHCHIPFLNACPRLRERMFLMTAPSKTFNLAGMQVSSAVIPNMDLRSEFREQKRQCGMGELNALAYTASELAYTRAFGWYEKMLEVIAENRTFVTEYLHDALPQVIVTPLEGTYLLWVDLRFTGLDPKELEKRNIGADLFFDEGYIFGKGGEGFERINLATPRTVLKAAMERFADLYR